MHRDISPFAPFSEANPLLNMVSVSSVHWLCISAGFLGFALLGIRRLFRKDDAPSGG